MVTWTKQAAFLLLLLASCARAQVGAVGQLLPSATSQMGTTNLNGMLDMSMMHGETDWAHRQTESASDSISKLDLKAPGPARRQYEKGMQSLYQKSFASAVEQLTKSLTLYPNFVAAHNALGTAYLGLGQAEQAQKEFAQAVALDDHLPNSHLNLGRAQIALKNHSAAQEAIHKASTLAPLDLHLFIALAYAQFLNHDYAAAIATAQRVHGRKHPDAAIVHYFAAAAWQGQNKLSEAQDELHTFLKEDPKSPAADTARQMLEKIKDWQNRPAAPAVEVAFSAAPSDSTTPPGALPAAGQRILQQLEEQRQVAQVEAEPESECEACAQPDPSAGLAAEPEGPIARAEHASLGSSPWVLRSTVNEVAIFFAATDHGKSVTDLNRQEVVIRDDGRPPAAVMSFRNEAQLPLRLGLVIDTSSSITHQFAFEQKAAASFLQRALTGSQDMAFVVGFSSAVLLVQDFTADENLIAQGIDQLAPAGGTALWDAVRFGSDKLVQHAEKQPVARILVVISDGESNTGTVTLKQAIETAEREEVIVYTVSTREFVGEGENSQVADHAMKVLAERTGGAAFFPASIGDLDHRLAELQQVIRSRYLISYRPAQFEANGKYHSIGIGAQKDGHKLRVYARRGYYAHAKSVEDTSF